VRECVTHHFACDCREEKFKKLIKEIQALRQLAWELDDYVIHARNSNCSLGKCQCGLDKIREKLPQIELEIK